MRLFRLTISVIVLACLAVALPEWTAAAPRPTIRLDTSVVEVRVLPKDRLEAYRPQREFNYLVQKPREMTFWERVKWWINDRIDELFSNKAVSTGFKWTLWLLTILVLGYGIMKLVGMEKVMLFVTGRKAPSLAFTTGEEDIHAMDLDAAIAEAEADGDLRRAVRMHYLRSLKMLSDRGRIEWSASKTNIDYLADLRGGALEDGFRRITRIFEYAWYGEMDIDKGQYDRAATLFRDFNQTVTV